METISILEHKLLFSASVSSSNFNEQSGVYSSKQELPAIAADEGQYSIIEWSTMGRLYPALIELEDIPIDYFTIKINWRVKPVE